MDRTEIGYEDVDWIHPSQDTVQWLALVNTVMILRVHKRRGIYRLAQRLSTSQEGFCSAAAVHSRRAGN
jgi:hypothetical protein